MKRLYTFHIMGPGVDSMTRATLEDLDHALEVTRLLVEKFQRDAARPSSQQPTWGAGGDLPTCDAHEYYGTPPCPACHES